jgi:peptidoglycan/xylan/chitin deacetylase (PgdA/CDA1 family)
MALQTPPRSSTPAPVILTGLALVGLTAVLLAYRAYGQLEASTPQPFPTVADFHLGELSTLRALSLDDAAASLPPAARAAPEWSSSVHPLLVIPEERARPLAELTWPPVLAQEQPIGEAGAQPGAQPDWSSGSHASAVPPPVLPRPPSPEIPANTLPRSRTPPPLLEEGTPTRIPLPADMLAHNFTRGNLSDSRLLLSFDGGSEASAAASILDTLEREGVRTTLFLTGEFIRNHPDLVHRILACGHEIGNHTEHHRHLTTWESNRRHDTRPDVDRSVLLGELEGARQALRQLTGVDMAPFWRAPYGEVNREILGWAADAGYLHVGWSAGLDSLDWVSDRASRRYRSPQEFLSVLVRKARGEPHGLNGTITLMHLHSNRPGADRFDRHLGETIRWLRAAGYDLVPASSLAGLTGVPGSAYRLTVSPATEEQ